MGDKGKREEVCTIQYGSKTFLPNRPFSLALPLRGRILFIVKIVDVNHSAVSEDDSDSFWLLRSCRTLDVCEAVSSSLSLPSVPFHVVNQFTPIGLNVKTIGGKMKEREGESNTECE